MLKRIFLTLLVSAGAACAQTYYIGLLGGYGFAPGISVTNPAGSATTGIKSGGALGVLGGGDTSEHWGGELRYMYSFSDLKLASGGTEVDFGAHTHIITGDLLRYFAPRASAVRPYVSFGGGVRILVGTGKESASQPLGEYAALTATRETLVLGDAGVGVKIRFTTHANLRLEVRDYVGAAPNKVIAPNVGSKIGGVLNDVIAQAIVSYTW
jgi:hypothetical protein